MSTIVLTTLNARYLHCAFGLRYLMANLGELQSSATLLEFEISEAPLRIAERLLAESPVIVGFGIYIWNVEQTTKVIGLLRKLDPKIVIVLGGPEVSYETEDQIIVQLADYVVLGEGDVAFRTLCEEILAQPVGPPSTQLKPKIIPSGVPALSDIALPYDLYSDKDIATRIVYVEASRGCPFSCEFCLSSIDIPVRQFALEPFLQAMQGLLDRGALHFKFVDRTFNLKMDVSTAILQFFLDRLRPGLFLHFEMIPDRLPDALRALLMQFPAGVVQLEVGIQSFNEEVNKRIHRRQDLGRLSDNLSFLKSSTGVHIHADLIGGLPGENLHSFANGFDQLYALGPHEIQLGILKRLKGTPICRHDEEFAMVYSPYPPFEVLRTAHLTFAELIKLKRFARFWDLIVNSGNFKDVVPALARDKPSVFDTFLLLTEWLFVRFARDHSIARHKLEEALRVYLLEVLARSLDEVEQLIPTPDSVSRQERSLRRARSNGIHGAGLPSADSSDAGGKASSGSIAKRQQQHLQ